MSTIFIISQIRQKAEGTSFSSSHFELRFHQNLRYAYPFSRSGVKGSRMQVLINTNHLDHLLNVVLFWANRWFHVRIQI